MRSKPLLLAAIASTLLLTGVMAGCGGDDESSSPSTGTTAPAFATGTTGETGSGKKDAGGTGDGPASAKDNRKDAPDDAISDRPGGPNAGPPVSPNPPK